MIPSFLRPPDSTKVSSGEFAIGRGWGQFKPSRWGQLRPSFPVHATRMEIYMHAPWTGVHEVMDADWRAASLSKYAEVADVIVDATGLSSFALLLAQIADRTRTPLVSAALYREGAVGRVRRQALESDTRMWLREPPDYPLIAVGPSEIPRFETGCSAPVNNASPLAVHAIAATLAESVIDLLAARYLLGDERIVVFRPLDEPPFDRIGTVR